MDRKPKKSRYNNTLMVDDVGMRLMLRAQFALAMCMPEIVTMSDTTGAICAFMNDKEDMPLLRLFKYDHGRAETGPHKIYLSFMPEWHAIIMRAKTLLLEKEGIDITVPRILLYASRDFITCTDEEMKNYLAWSRETMSQRVSRK